MTEKKVSPVTFRKSFLPKKKKNQKLIAKKVFKDSTRQTFNLLTDAFYILNSDIYNILK